jgi:hypothetical protein
MSAKMSSTSPQHSEATVNAMTEPTNRRRWPYRSLSLPLIGQHQHEAERVRGERPRGPVDRRSESALQGVQCRRDDRGVDRHHQQRQRDDGEHQRTPNGTVGVAPFMVTVRRPGHRQVLRVR